MADTQSILHNITNMQRNAQEALPVMPNNGNPGGAYNMPAQAPQEQQPAPPPPDPYAFLKPSPYMDGVRAILAGQAQSLAAQQQPTPPPIQQAPILPTGMY